MKNQSGFSLIEVMVALMVMLIGLMGLMGISSITMRAAIDNERWNMARMVATSHSERLSSLPLATLQAMPAVGGPLVETHNGAPLTVSWTLAPTGTVSQPILIVVSVAYSAAPLHPPVVITTLRTFAL